MLDLNSILNTEETVKIGEKIFKVRELTLKERAKLETILREYVAKLNSLKDNADALTKEISTKDSTDFQFIRIALATCNTPDLDFSETDFEALTLSQVTKLQEMILRVNNFLPQVKTKEAEAT